MSLQAATHACRCRDGVGSADERLAVVKADEDVHCPARKERDDNYNNLILHCNNSSNTDNKSNNKIIIKIIMQL